jgi:hypothetical protein
MGFSSYGYFKHWAAFFRLDADFACKFFVSRLAGTELFL